MEEPRKHTPRSHRRKPLGVQSSRQQRGNRERERNRSPYVTEIEIGRMNRHPGVLELRVESTSVGRNPVEPLERIGAEADRGEEENENERKGDRHVRHQL